jgi:hypothetical protein
VYPPLPSPWPHISIFSVHCTVSAVAAAPARHLLSPLRFPVLWVVRCMLSCKCSKGRNAIGRHGGTDVQRLELVCQTGH